MLSHNIAKQHRWVVRHALPRSLLAGTTTLSTAGACKIPVLVETQTCTVLEEDQESLEGKGVGEEENAVAEAVKVEAMAAEGNVTA